MTRPARELAGELGRRAGAFDRAYADLGPAIGDQARARYFPDHSAFGWEQAVLGAAVRAYVAAVDPHGQWVPHDEEASLYLDAQKSREAALDKANKVVANLLEMRLQKAAELVERCISETLAYYGYPQTHWLKIRTNNPLERIMREIRRRTRVVGAFPDGDSAVMLVAARLRHIASSKWGTRNYVSMDWLRQQELEGLFRILCHSNSSLVI